MSVGFGLSVTRCTVVCYEFELCGHIYCYTLCHIGTVALRSHPGIGDCVLCGVCLCTSWTHDGFWFCSGCFQGTCYSCSGEIMYRGFIEYRTHKDVDLAALVRYDCPYCRKAEGVIIDAWELPRAPPARMFVLGSDLNGNNGEWTNGDDLAAPAGGRGGRGGVDAGLRQMQNAAQFSNPSATASAYHARQRREHQTNPGAGGRRGGRGNAPPPQRQPAAAVPAANGGVPEPPLDEEVFRGIVDNIVNRALDSIPDPPPPVEEVVTTYVVHPHLSMIAWNGEEFFNLSEPGVFGGIPTMCMKTVVGSIQVIMVDGVVSPRNTEQMTVAPFSVVRCPAYRRRDILGKWMDFAETEYLVVEPLWRLLMKSYRSPNVTEPISRAVFAQCACYNQYRGIAPMGFRTLCEDTGQAFLSRLHHLESTRVKTSFTGTLITNNFETVGVDGDCLYTNPLIAINGIEDYSTIVRVLDVNATMPLDYIVRGDFHIRMSGGVGMDADGRPVFPETQHPISRYRTVFFSFSGFGQAEWCEHAPTPYNLNRALKRMLGGKANEVTDRATAIAFGGALCFELARTNPGTLDEFRKLLNGRDLHLTEAPWPFDAENATTFANFLASVVGLGSLADRALLKNFNSSLYDPVMSVGVWAYAKVWEAQATFLAPFYNRTLCGDVVHARGMVRRSYLQGKAYADPSDIYVQRLVAKLKREIAKAGRVPKAPRLTVSYEEGCMYANELPEYVKKAINGCHRIPITGGVTLTLIIVGKPKDHPLSERLSLLIECVNIPGECCALIYSDDFCLSGCIGKFSFAGNGDISSNDSSQDIPAFLAAWYCMAAIHPEHAGGLIDQCMLPIRVVSPEDRADKIDITFDGPFEGSGTVLTTILNHLGTALGCICVIREFSNSIKYADPLAFGEDINFAQSVARGFRQIGHSVTWFDCCPGGQLIAERLQFLKHSPCRTTDGRWVSVLNAGAMLRSLGSVENDLLAHTLCVTNNEFSNMSHDERINRFVGAVVAGHVHEHPTPVLTALRRRFPSQVGLEIRKDSISLEFEPALAEAGVVIDVDSWMRRYDLFPHEVDEMVAAISTIRVGLRCKCTGFAKIYHVDYDMEYL